MSAPSNRTVPLSLSRLPEIWPINVVLPAPIRTDQGVYFAMTYLQSDLLRGNHAPNRFETLFSSSMLLPREQTRDALRANSTIASSTMPTPKPRAADSSGHRGEPLHAVVGDQVFQTEQPAAPITPPQSCPTRPGSPSP